MAKTEKDDFKLLLEDDVQDIEDTLETAKELRSAYQAVLEHKLLESNGYGRLITKAMEEGLNENAVLICKEAIKNYPHKGTFYLSCSISLVQLGRLEEAVMIVEEGFANDPEFAREHRAGKATKRVDLPN